MKAIILTHNNDEIGGLEFADLPIPEINDNEVLIKVNAIDINPVDNKTLSGKGQFNNIKAANPIILGWDVSGVITGIGKNVTSFKTGDHVFGLLNFPGHGKTYAEYVAADPTQLALKPENIDDETAAATTLSALMAYQALMEANLKPGERVLIQGAAGGVGFFALQIAKHLGAYVIGTATAADAEFLKNHGLDELIDFKTTDFEQATSNIDFVLDTLGGQSTLKAFNILSPNGRVITIPSGVGDSWKTVATQRHINAQFLFVHSSGTDMKALAELLKKNVIRPNIAHRFKMEDIIAIHEKMSTGKIWGKIVVSFN